MQTWDKYVRRGGLLLVLSGPSGVGKDAVLGELEKICPSVQRCVTVTTRPRRENEQNGVDYTFVSAREFRQRAEEGAFLEYAEVHGYLYGTPRQWVEDQLSNGIDVILKIDVQGGLNVKRAKPEAILVFLVPPSLEELERRLRSRNSESEESITRRLLNARKELEQIPHYDYMIENSSIEYAVEELKAVIVAEHCRIRK
jgi:guanylate kinase